MLRYAQVAPPAKKCAFVLTRDGRPVKVQRTIFSECFYTMAMNELWRVTGDARYQVRGRLGTLYISVPSPSLAPGAWVRARSVLNISPFSGPAGPGAASHTHCYCCYCHCVSSLPQRPSPNNPQRGPGHRSVQFSHSVMSDSLRPHESQHARPPCPSPIPRVHSDSRPSRHDDIQPSHPLSSPSPPASNPSQHQSFPMSQFFTSGGQKYWSFSFRISPSNEYSGLIFFRMGTEVLPNQTWAHVQ